MDSRDFETKHPSKARYIDIEVPACASFVDACE